MRQRVARKLLDRAEPEMPHRRALFRMERVDRRDGSEVDRAILREDCPQRLGDAIRHATNQVELVRELLRRRHVGHWRLMLVAGFRTVERGREAEDRAAVLDGRDLARGEARAIAQSIDEVDDW